MTTHGDASTGQVTKTAAEVYEDFFVPALFGQWPERVLDAAGQGAGHDVLDVGCGTGVLARAAARRNARSVTGVDVNEGMLAVAERSTSTIDWQRASAERLPFDDNSFDCTVSQFALMFFADKPAALREMGRVTGPNGSVTVATWASVDQSPGYAAMVELLRRLFGEDAATALLAPFTIGTEEELRGLCATAFENVTVERHEGEARFDSLAGWVHTDIRGWTLDDMIDDDQFAHLMNEAQTALGQFVQDDGSIRFAAPALVATMPIESHG